MTMTALQASAELADTPCTVGECLETASTMGVATVRIDPGIDAPPDFQTLTFGLPLCSSHAHLLSRGCQLLDFHIGL
jgi:hypothetical protein